MLSTWVEIISSRLGTPIYTCGDEVRFNCFTSGCRVPGRAPDTSHHLYVNPSKEKYFCQRCQRGGTLEYLTKVLGLPSSPNQDVSLWKKVISEFVYGTPHVEEADEVDLPDDYVVMLGGSKAFKYLQTRGITWNQVEFYGLGFGTKELKNRVIFPDCDSKGNLVYWVARTYGNHKVKYKNAPVPRTKKVYNLGRITRLGYRKQVVICEGTISANVAGYNAVCTYGRYVTSQQVELIVGLNADHYVVAFDGDAFIQNLFMATKLGRKGLNVSVVQFAYDEDPASVGYEAMQEKISKSVPWERFGLEVLR